MGAFVQVVEMLGPSGIHGNRKLSSLSLCPYPATTRAGVPDLSFLTSLDGLHALVPALFCVQVVATGL